MIRHRGLSCLQRKGLSLLSLILIAESVTFSNAVKLWSSFETLVDENHGRKKSSSTFFSKFKKIQAEDGLSSTTAPVGGGSCDAASSKNGDLSVSSSITRFLNNQQQRRRGIVSIEDCCARCSTNCMEPSGRMFKTCNEIPRGGHSGHHGVHSAAESLAEAAADVAPYGLPLHLWKIVFQAILTTINVACWLIPLRSKKISENKLGLSLANAFSGGVFLSLAFGHLIPECVHGFGDYQEAVPFMLVLSGYLLIFFVEKVAFDAHDILHEMESGGGSHAGHNHGKSNGVSKSSEENQGSGGRGAVILLGALAVHSILEMMALGLADKFGDCALLTLSIALHQVRILLLLCFCSRLILDLLPLLREIEENGESPVRRDHSTLRHFQFLIRFLSIVPLSYPCSRQNPLRSLSRF